MPNTSPIVDQMLRKHVSPVLRDAGFQKVNARNGWLWQTKAIWVVSIHATGTYFSDVTGWPPGSVSVSLGVYYTFIPETIPIKLDAQQRLLPAEHQCHMRTKLSLSIEQPKQLTLCSSGERQRTDIWWVEPDGSNAELVALDIAHNISNQGLNWHAKMTDLRSALLEVENQRDCYSKFGLAAFLAREVGDDLLWQKYSSLAEAEGKRIGKPTGSWLENGYMNQILL